MPPPMSAPTTGARMYTVNQPPRLAQADPDERYALEQTLFGVSHDRVGEVLAEAWELPPELRRVMGQHHSPLLSTNNTDDALCRVALCTDWMAAVRA